MVAMDDTDQRVAQALAEMDATSLVGGDGFLQSITPRGLLSFGPDTAPLELRPLNVLIGPNGSGKSNLIDVIRLVRSLPTAQEPLWGSEGWAWDGHTPNPTSLELTVRPVLSGQGGCRHRLEFLPNIMLEREEIVQSPRVWAGPPAPEGEVLYLASMFERKVQLLARDGNAINIPWDELERPHQSALSQFRSPIDYPVITGMSSRYEQIRIYDYWESGRKSAIRTAQPADMRGDILEDDYSNLVLFLNQTIDLDPAFRPKVVEGMSDLYPRFTDYRVVATAGMVQLFGIEGDKFVPAARLSDGTLRYLSLLAILYNPKPPPLVCLEEPELGLHPDIVAGLAKHLLAASERMQLIVTTHSDILIDALSETPESIVVFENEDGSTRMKRLDADELKVWLKKYGLGQLWTRGQIGGNRW